MIEFGCTAIFWECKPTSQSNFNTTNVEFVLLTAHELMDIPSDIESFRQKFE